jgi:hypothetical protein
MRVPTRQRTGSVPSGAVGSPVQHSAPNGTARMAGWSGIVFSALLVAGLVLVNRIPKLGDSDAVYNAFYGGSGVDTLTVLGLYIVPFAGIACLWHMIATRTLLRSAVPARGRRSRTGCTWPRA